MKSKQDDSWAANVLFKLALYAEQQRLKSATGTSAEDAKYDAADSARPADIENYAYVMYHGKEYGPYFISWGPIDGDPNKLTVLANTDEGWITLWFLRSQVE